MTEETQSNSTIPPKVESPTVDSTKRKSEDEILFPDVEVDGYTIRPWTLGKLKKINPHIENVFSTLRAKNINLTISNLESHAADLYFAAIPEIMTILAISLDTTEEKLEDTTIPQAIRLIFLVFKQNEESIKNVLSLLQMTMPQA